MELLFIQHFFSRSFKGQNIKTLTLSNTASISTKSIYKSSTQSDIPWLEVSVQVEPDVVVRPDKPEVYVYNSDVLLQASDVTQYSAVLCSYLVFQKSLRFLLASSVQAKNTENIMISIFAFSCTPFCYQVIAKYK